MKPKSDRTIDDDLTTIRRLIVASVVVVIAIGTIFWLSSRSTDQNFIRQRATSRVGACSQANELALKSRQSAADQARVLIAASNAANPNNPTAAQQAQIDAYLAAQIAAARKTFPLRDCTPTGISDFYNNAPTAEPCAHGGDGKGYCK